MKVLAVLCALANLLAIGFVAWLMLFVALFPWENTTPEERTANDWLVPVAVVLAASALALLLCVAIGWQGWAVGALALQTAVSILVLAYALEGSSHSDGTLAAAALGIEFAAVAAVWLLRAHVAAEASGHARVGAP